MSIDNLITIAVIIYVIYSIIKVFSSGKKKATDGKPKETGTKKGGWAEKLGDFINEIKEEIEKAHQEAGTQKTDPYEYEEEYSEIETPPGIPGDRRHEYEPVKSETLYTTERDESFAEIPPVPEESHRNFHGSHDMPDPVFDSLVCRKPAFEMRKADLKKAVIWSEIISKPIGLRDNF